MPDDCMKAAKEMLAIDAWSALEQRQTSGSCKAISIPAAVCRRELAEWRAMAAALAYAAAPTLEPSAQVREEYWKA